MLIGRFSFLLKRIYILLTRTLALLDLHCNKIKKRREPYTTDIYTYTYSVLKLKLLQQSDKRKRTKHNFWHAKRTPLTKNERKKTRNCSSRSVSQGTLALMLISVVYHERITKKNHNAFFVNSCRCIRISARQCVFVKHAIPGHAPGMCTVGHRCTGRFWFCVISRGGGCHWKLIKKTPKIKKVRCAPRR